MIVAKACFGLDMGWVNMGYDGVHISPTLRLSSPHVNVAIPQTRNRALAMRGESPSTEGTSMVKV